MKEVYLTLGKIKLQEFFNTEAVVQKCTIKKGVLRNFVKFKGKHLCLSLSLDKVACLKLRRSCFSENTARFLRTPFFKEHICWLILLISHLVLVSHVFVIIIFLIHFILMWLLSPISKYKTLL